MIDIKIIKTRLKINSKDIDTDIMKQSEYLFWLGNEISKADKDAELKKAQLEIAESKKGNKLRRISADLGEKLTEAALTSKIKASKSVIKMKNELIDANAYAKLVQLAHRSMVVKGDMLTQLGFNRRKEIDYNIRKQVSKQKRREARD